MLSKRGRHAASRARAVLAAAGAAIIMIALARDLAATPLDAAAYNIKAQPRAGPIHTFQPVAALPPIPFHLPFDWSADPYADEATFGATAPEPEGATAASGLDGAGPAWPFPALRAA